MYKVGDMVKFVECREKPNAIELAQNSGLVIGDIYTVEHVCEYGGITTLYVNGIDIGFITDIFELACEDSTAHKNLKGKMMEHLSVAKSRGFGDKTMRLTIEEMEIIINSLQERGKSYERC